VIRRVTVGVGNAVLTWLSILAAGAYVFVLFYFWNVWLAVAACVLMASRLPDLIWEIRTGRKPARKDRPRGPIYFLASTFSWAAFVLVWYSLSVEIVIASAR
jgi:hypothetical protein